jgi:hypothetical protein
VAVKRIGTRIGVVPPKILTSLDEVLRLHLALQEVQSLRLTPSSKSWPVAVQ